MFMTWPVIFLFAWVGVEWLLDKTVRVAPAADWGRYLFALKVAVLFGLMFLGTRQQFAWYYYG